MKLHAAWRIAIVSAVLTLPPPAEAGGSSRGGTFILRGWDARGQSLGGAAALLVRDEAAVHYNPANLVFLDAPRIGAGTMNPVPGLDARFNVLSFGGGLLDRRASRDGTASVRRLAVAASFSHLGLELAGGSRWNEGSAGVAAAFSFNNYNFVGLGWRVLKSWTDLEEAGAWGSALDFGFTTRLTDRIWLAAVARDGWSTIHFPHRHETIDPSFVLAGSFERLFGRLSAEIDAVMRAGSLHGILCGAELILLEEVLAIQGGIDVRNTDYERMIPWFGVSAGYGGAAVSLAFGFDPDDAFGRQTRVSAGYGF